MKKPQNPLFSQNVIAMIWDYDKTLIPEYMQGPLFKKFGVDPGTFWNEVNALGEYYRQRNIELVAEDMIYLNHILTYARPGGPFDSLTNETLRELGKEIEFYPGLPDFFVRMKELVHSVEEFAKHDVKLEHYVVSTGLRQMILGSRLAEYIDHTWACEFIEMPAPPGYLEDHPPLLGLTHPISQIAYSIDNTTKTRAIFEINKGTNKFPRITVNAAIAEHERRVPFQNMIYVADGPSDIPVFSILNAKGGRTFAVYKHGSAKEFAQVNELQKQGRVQSFGEANYEPGSQTSMWLENAVREIGHRIVRDRDSALGDRVGKPPRHLSADDE